MLIKKEKKSGITTYIVDKNIPDDKMDKLKNTFVNRSQIDLIIDHDADVYDTSGELLLKFRKNKLTQSKVDSFYDNVIKFAKTISTNRGSTSGSKTKNVADNPKIMTNILGYMDTFSPQQKFMMKTQGKHIKIRARETKFNMDYPSEFEQATQLIKEIDKYYKQYAPDYYKKQKHKADQTNFKIDDTSFTTITTNLNFRTSIHTDKGDDAEGFGNLTVIQRGKYEGGETCFPQYGVGVDVREGDLLFMNVHKWHGNLPMKFENKDATRLSIVCYLRINVWKNTIGISKRAMIKHNQAVKNLRKHTQDNKKTRKIRIK